MKRKTSIMLIIILVLTSILSACSKEEMALLSAMKRLSTAKSYAQNSHVSFSMNFACNDEITKANLQRYQHLFQSMTYDTRVKYNGDAENGQFKAFMEADFSMDPITVSSDIWFDFDVSGEDTKYQIVVRVPELFKVFLPDAYCKDYLNIDYMEYIKWIGAESGAVASVDITQSGAMQENFLDLLQLMRQCDTQNSNFVLMSTTSDGLTKLSLKLTDAQLKSFIIAVAEGLTTNSELLDQFMVCFMPIAAAMGAPIETMDQATMKQMLVDGITSALPGIKAYFATHKILGSNGLRYEVVLNADDYIVDETLSVNVYIDETLLSAMMYTSKDDFEGHIDFTVTMKNEYTNINEEVALGYPVLTAANSVDLVKTMKAQAIVDAENARFSYFPYTWYYSYIKGTALYDMGYENYMDFPLKGTFAGNPVDTTIQIVNYEDELCYYMPLRQAAQIFGGTVAWDGELGLATWTVDGETMFVLTSASDELLDEDDNGVFDWGEDWIEFGYIHNGTTYLDMENAGWFVDAEFGFDVDTNTILLR